MKKILLSLSLLTISSFGYASDESADNLTFCERTEEFIDYIVDGTSPNVTTQEVLDSMAVAFAIEASLISGQPEPVSYAKLSRKDQ